MIKSFSSLYAGHVLEGEGIGFNGIPHDDRWFSNERLIEVFEIAKESAILMDELGYDVLWMAEHHFQREGYECIPNLLILSQYLSQFTKNLKFGCGFNILPMWHPIRLAEDFAMVDILTGGRVIFGIGRGYHTREVETFGAPMRDPDANRELFEEQFEIIMKAFNEESFAHKGKHYTLPPEIPYRGYTLKEITVVPRPVNRPVEVWQPVVSGSERGMDFMAKHGIKGLILGTHTDYVDEYMHKFQAANAKYGRELPLGGNLALGLWAYLEDTVEKAEVWLGKDKEVALVVDRDVTVTLPRRAKRTATIKVVYTGPIPSPITKGDTIAKLIIAAPDVPLLEFALKAGKTVERLGFVGRLSAGLRYLIWGTLK